MPFKIQIGFQKGCVENSSSIFGYLTKFETILHLLHYNLPLTSYKLEEASLLQPYFLLKIVNNTYYFLLCFSIIIGVFSKDNQKKYRWINEVFVAVISQSANIFLINRMDKSELINSSLAPTALFYGVYLYSCFLLSQFHLYA